MGAIQVETGGDGVARLFLDTPDKSVNVLTPALMEELEALLPQLESDSSVDAVVIASRKPAGFLAGADLDVLEGLSAEEAAALSRAGNALLSRVANCPKPFVAAVHGPALGGGLEVALACRFLVASDDPATVLALPEVQLGLLPGGGGTQRLPRRVGLVAALPMLLTGKRVRARRASRMGLVDLVTTPGGIAETAARAARLVADGELVRPEPKRPLLQRLADAPPGRALALRRARAEVERRTRGLYPAPAAILDCVETGLSRGVEAGLERESVLFGELAASAASRSLLRLFHWTNELKRERGEAPPRPVRRVAVLGAGFMGAGIASVSLKHVPVVLRDLSDEALAAAAKTVHGGLEAQLRSGALRSAERDRRWSRLQLTRDLAGLRRADLVVEAVFEDLELKRRVLAEAEELLAPEAVFASNTSALPIAEIARDARHPGRVLGMHYFSPVPKMPLLELVAAERTEPWALETARALGQAQGKTVVVVRDGPGFYTTRVLAPYLNEAMVLLGEGARVEDVDAAALDFGFPVGPCALLDEVGIDVGAHVSRDLGGRFAHRAGAPSDALQRLYDAGYRGRKHGKGFYSYASGRRGRKPVNPAVYEHFGGPARRELPRAEVQDRLVLQMAGEAVHCLAEGVIASPRDGDVAAVLGLGFAPPRGGPFRHLDALGAEAVARRLGELAERCGERFRPPPLLDEQRAGGGRFHGD